MTMPRTMRLLTQRISIALSENIPDPTVEQEEGHLHLALGTYDNTINHIVIDKHLAPDRQRMVFLHENLHAMLDFAGLDATIAAHASGLDEHIVGALAPVLMSWLRENPRAVAYLSERT